MVGLSWTYPEDALVALKRAAAATDAATPVATGIAVEQLHFNYAVTSDRPAWRPVRAFDDGRQTFIEFRATLAVGEAPPIFLVDRKGRPPILALGRCVRLRLGWRRRVDSISGREA